MSTHIPLRTCLGCRQTKAKNELIRIVRTPAGKVIMDPSGKREGRGAYFCPSISCLRLGFKKIHKLSYALRTPLTPQELSRLKEELTSSLGSVHGS